jgi:hypothetical protein
VVRGLQGYLARHNLAVALMDLGEPGRAAEQWRLVLEEVPGYGPGRRGLAECVRGQAAPVRTRDGAEILVAARS